MCNISFVDSAVYTVCEFSGMQCILTSLYGDDAVLLPIIPVCESGLMEDAVDWGMIGFS